MMVYVKSYIMKTGRDMVTLVKPTCSCNFVQNVVITI